VIHYPEPSIHTDIKSLVNGHKHIVIDAPPGTSDITLSILLASHLCIIPVEPSALSIWASTEIIDLIKEARVHNKKLKGRLLISRKVTGTTPGKEARDALSAYKTPIFNTEISQRIDFVKSLIAGMTVLDYAPKSEAAKEITALCAEIANKKK
jgi:chromosome partitioning protein